MGEDRLKKLLLKYLMGNLDAEEAAELELWRNQAPENQQLFDRMQDKQHLQKRYNHYLEAANSANAKAESGKSASSPLWIWGLAGLVAAALILLAVLIPALQKPAMITYQAPQKGIASVVLPDGSKVWLKSRSSITYPEKFKKSQRLLSFIGEGYFEVASSEVPFVVAADGFQVRVTGTKFNIKSYRTDNQALTALLEGEVSIAYTDSLGVEKEEKMVGGDLSVFDKARHRNSIVKANTSLYASWIGGVYYFESETLENILKEICRYYGYNLILSEGVIKDKILSGRLEMDNDASGIIEAFQEFFPGHIMFDQNTIIIQ